MGTTSGRPVVQRVGCKPTSQSDGMVPRSNKRVEPMTRSAFTLIPNSGADSACLLNMRRRYRILLGTALVALLLFAMWLTFHSGVPQHRLSVGLTATHGADQITVAWVTNNGRAAITLDEPYAQREYAAGRLVRDQGASWNQAGYSKDLSPGRVAWLAYGFDDTTRLKVCFEYHRNGGPVLRAISKPASMLPLRKLPRPTYDWLRRNGIVDGKVYGHYESPWIASPQGGANGRQPIRSGTNQTSPAAASRRSL